jgi:hypothetical protein
VPRRFSIDRTTAAADAADARVTFNSALAALLGELAASPLVYNPPAYVELVRNITDRVYRDDPRVGANELREMVRGCQSTQIALYYAKAAPIYARLADTLLAISQR